jgi:hypothetical protein
VFAKGWLSYMPCVGKEEKKRKEERKIDKIMCMDECVFAKGMASYMQCVGI